MALAFRLPGPRGNSKIYGFYHATYLKICVGSRKPQEFYQAYSADTLTQNAPPPDPRTRNSITLNSNKRW